MDADAWKGWSTGGCCAMILPMGGKHAPLADTVTRPLRLPPGEHQLPRPLQTGYRVLATASTSLKSTPNCRGGRQPVPGAGLHQLAHLVAHHHRASLFRSLTPRKRFMCP
jgi:hypothetical protein